MFAQDCIDTSIPFVRLTDTVGFVLNLMQEYKVQCLAIVEKDLFMGMINENILLESDDTRTIDSFVENFQQLKITEGTHLFDVLKKTTEESTYDLPVVSIDNEYIGITAAKKILNMLVLNSSLISSGGIIVLELEAKDYSLTEISKIVESNSAMILHTMMTTSVNQNYMQISLKINKNDLKDIQMAFERYRYKVIAVLHQSEYEVQLKERFDSLMKYLEV